MSIPGFRYVQGGLQLTDGSFQYSMWERNWIRRRRQAWIDTKNSVAQAEGGGASGLDADESDTANVTTSANQCTEFKISVVSASGTQGTSGRPHWNSTNKPDIAAVDYANPNISYRLYAVVGDPAGVSSTVPGFWYGDGLGGIKGGEFGIRYNFDATGVWTVDLHWGWAAPSTDYPIFAIAPSSVSATVTPWPHGERITVNVSANTGSGLYASGPLLASAGHYRNVFKGNGTHFVKRGLNSPENWLGYKGFKNTVDKPGGTNTGLHYFEDHQNDFNANDPAFNNGLASGQGRWDSSGIIGALNYLSDTNINSIYMLMCNIFGDGYDTNPFYPLGDGTGWLAKVVPDVEKLYQWTTFLEHAQHKGIATTFQLFEREMVGGRQNATPQWYLADPGSWSQSVYYSAPVAGVPSNPAATGGFGNLARAYVRTLIAWFNCLPGIKWSLCEEQSASGSPVASNRMEFSYAELKNFGNWIRDTHPRNVPICIHTDITLDLYNDLTNAEHWPDTSGWLTNTSLYCSSWMSPTINGDDTGSVSAATYNMRDFTASVISIFKNASPSAAIVVDLDEQHPYRVSSAYFTPDNVRKTNIWQAYLNGAGYEHYLPGDTDSMDHMVENFRGTTATNTSSIADLSAILSQTYFAASAVNNHFSSLNNVSAVHTLVSAADVTTYTSALCLGDINGLQFIAYYPKTSASSTFGGTITLSAAGSGVSASDKSVNFSYFDPRTGVETASGSFSVSTSYTIPPAPSGTTEDWAILIK